MKKSFFSVFDNKNVGDIASPRQGLATSNNKRFLKYWNEVAFNNINFNCKSREEAKKSDKKWFPYNKGGSYRKWFGNNEYVINWENDGEEVIELASEKYNSPTRTIKNMQFYFKKSITWSALSSSKLALRYCGEGFIFDTKGQCIFHDDTELLTNLCGILNSNYANEVLKILAPTLDFNSGTIAKVPVKLKNKNKVSDLVNNCIKIAKEDWDAHELSWDYKRNELLKHKADDLETSLHMYKAYWSNKFRSLLKNEIRLNEVINETYDLNFDFTESFSPKDITIQKDEITQKDFSKFSSFSELDSKDALDNIRLSFKDEKIIEQFISYAVGCMFGRYSLDKEGLILANKGETLEDYLKKVEKSEEELTFLPDDDNIIPVLDEDWFEDDIVGRFRAFLKASFGEENFEKNLAFVEENITHGDIRKYFNKTFYRDHYKRYNKRPIYWMISSPNGVFKALIYMHRYTPDTLNRMLNDYLREYKSKLTYRKDHLQEIINSSSDASEVNQAEKEQRKLEDMLRELEEYERNVLMPLATERIEIDLDDGVSVNYNKFGKAVEEIKSVNTPKKKKKVKEFDWVDGGEIR